MSVNWFEQFKGSVCDKHTMTVKPPFLPIIKRGLDGFIQAENQ